MASVSGGMSSVSSGMSSCGMSSESSGMARQVTCQAVLAAWLPGSAWVAAFHRQSQLAQGQAACAAGLAAAEAEAGRWCCTHAHLHCRRHSIQLSILEAQRAQVHQVRQLSGHLQRLHHSPDAEGRAPRQSPASAPQAALHSIPTQNQAPCPGWLKPACLPETVRGPEQRPLHHASASGSARSAR